MTLDEKLSLCKKILKKPPKKMGLKQHFDLLFDVYPNLFLEKRLKDDPEEAENWTDEVNEARATGN